MLITASTADIKRSLKMLLRGSAKACINFYYKGDGYLRLQCNCNGVVVECAIFAHRVEDFMNRDITVFIDRTFELLDDGIKITSIGMYDDLLNIMQDGFMFSATRQPELRLDLDGRGQGGMNFNMSEMQQAVVGSKSLDSVARELGADISKLSIVDGKAYTLYSNTGLIAGCALPDLTFSGNVARTAATMLKGGGVSCVIAENKSNIYWSMGDGLAVVAPLSYPDIKVIEMVGGVMSKLQHVSNLNLQTQNLMLDSVSKLYKKTSVVLGICKNGLSVFIDNAKTQANLGCKDTPLLNIRVSTGQLGAICKVFDGCEGVEILRGVNKICMISQSCRKTLLIAGMLF